MDHDGFELQFGTNHFGHYALTGLLMPRLLSAPRARVVTVSSLGHKMRSAIDFDDLDARRRYSAAAAYGRSKLANLLFTYELNRRLRAGGHPAIAVAAHPGAAATDLTRHMPRSFRRLVALADKTVFQSPEMGALSTLRAATDPAVDGGRYFGPGGAFEIRGYPVEVASSRQSLDQDLQQRLWQVSEQRTGVIFPL